MSLRRRVMGQSGGDDLAFKFAGSYTVTEETARISLVLPENATQIVLRVTEPITVNRKSWFYIYKGSEIIGYLADNSTTLSARTILLGRLFNNGGIDTLQRCFFAADSARPDCTILNRVSFTEGSVISMGGYYADALFTGGTIELWYR